MQKKSGEAKILMLGMGVIRASYDITQCALHRDQDATQLYLTYIAYHKV